VLVPAFGAIELAGVLQGTPAVKWSKQNAAWACADVSGLDPTWSTTASQGMRQVLIAANGKETRPVFLVAEREASAAPPFVTTLRAMRIVTNGVTETIWHASGLVGDLQFVALASDEQGKLGASLRLRLPEGAPLSVACE